MNNHEKLRLRDPEVTPTSEVLEQTLGGSYAAYEAFQDALPNRSGNGILLTRRGSQKDSTSGQQPGEQGRRKTFTGSMCMKDASA